MHALIPSQRRAPIAVARGAMLVAGIAGSACSSGNPAAVKPQGLSGTQANSYDGSQSSNEDEQAATVLTPQPGSFLAGKATVAALH